MTQREPSLPSMPLWPLRPCADAIVSADEVVARVYGVVAIRPPTYQLAVDEDAAAVVRAQRVRE